MRSLILLYDIKEATIEENPDYKTYAQSEVILRYACSLLIVRFVRFPFQNDDKPFFALDLRERQNSFIQLISQKKPRLIFTKSGQSF